jgi:membrane protease YdiL (CAAX protease family)
VVSGSIWVSFVLHALGNAVGWLIHVIAWFVCGGLLCS